MTNVQIWERNVMSSGMRVRTNRIYTSFAGIVPAGSYGTLIDDSVKDRGQRLIGVDFDDHKPLGDFWFYLGKKGDSLPDFLEPVTFSWSISTNKPFSAPRPAGEALYTCRQHVVRVYHYNPQVDPFLAGSHDPLPDWLAPTADVLADGRLVIHRKNDRPLYVRPGQRVVERADESNRSVELMTFDEAEFAAAFVPVVASHAGGEDGR